MDPEKIQRSKIQNNNPTLFKGRLLKETDSNPVKASNVKCTKWPKISFNLRGVMSSYAEEEVYLYHPNKRLQHGILHTYFYWLESWRYIKLGPVANNRTAAGLTCWADMFGGKQAQQEKVLMQKQLRPGYHTLGRVLAFCVRSTTLSTSSSYPKSPQWTPKVPPRF